MTRSFLTRRQLIAAAFAAACAPRVGSAAPMAYVMAPSGAQITYTFLLNGTAQTGTVPVDRADLRVDPDNLAASTADVTADVRRAKTGLIFATQALKSAEVLNAAAHPLARFTSTGVTLNAAGRLSGGARIDGRLTLRGQTRRIRLDADIFRPAGTAVDDFRVLDVRLAGNLSRAAYGATGFADLVDDRVRIDITARIMAAS